jgi:adenylate cyclase
VSSYARVIEAGRRELDVNPPARPTSIDVIGAALESVAPGAGWLSSPDGSLTLMLSDIAEADRLSAELGPERWEQLLSDHHLLVERLLAHHDGAVVRFEQDGFLATFNSAHGGVYAALELQRTFGGAGGGAGGDPGRPPVALRIGLHSGFIIGAPDEPLGRNVVLATRIAGQARGGETLVSAALKQYTEGDPTLQFEDRGEHHFKGLHGEHEIFSVTLR